MPELENSDNATAEIEESFERKRLNRTLNEVGVRTGEAVAEIADSGRSGSQSIEIQIPPPKPGERDVISDQPEQEDEGSFLDSSVETVGDIIRGMVSGPRQAVVELGQSVESAGDFLRENSETVRDLDEFFGGKVEFQIPELVDRPEGFAGKSVEGMAQFVTGFLPIFKATKAVAVAAKAKQASGVKTLLTSDALTGALAFDPEDPNISNLLGELSPEIAKPVFEFLATDPNDSEALNRLRNGIQDLGLGIATEKTFKAFMKAVEAIRKSRAAKQVVEEQIAQAQVKSPDGEKVTPDGKEAELKKGDSADKAKGDKAGEPKKAEDNFKLKEEPDAGPAVKTSKVDGKTAKQGDLFLNKDFSDLNISGLDIGVNFDKIDSPEAAKQALAKVIKLYKRDINQARRGKISLEQTNKLADDLGMDAETLIDRRGGVAFNAEEALAARKILVASTKELTRLADSVSQGGVIGAAAKPLFLAHFAKHVEIQKQVAGIAAEAGRALRVFGRDVAPEVAYSSKLAQIAEAGTIGRNGAEKLSQMVLNVDQMGNMNKFVRKATRASTTDKILEYWINWGLLSGFKTHSVNIISGFSNAGLFQIPERAIGAALSKTMSGEIKAGEPLAMMLGSIQGLIEGIGIGVKSFVKGTPSGNFSRFTKMENFERKAITAQEFGLEDESGHAMLVDFLGEVNRLPGRALTAEDEFMKAIGYRMEVWAQAYRKGIDDNLEGGDFAKGVKEFIDDPEKFGIHLQGVDMAEYVTFTKRLGEFGRSVQKQTSEVPELKFGLPFIRVVSNIPKFVGERIPVLPSFFSRAVKEELRAGGARREMAIAKQLYGLGLFTMFGWMAHNGLVTGNGPADGAIKRTRRNTGWQEVSIVKENEYISLARLDPLSSFIGIAADVVEISQDISNGEMEDLAGNVLTAFSRNFASKTWLTGVHNLTTIITDPTVGASKAKRMVQQIGSSFVPNLSNQIAKETDPTLRATRTMIDKMKARIPGLSDDLPPRRNMWADPIDFGGSAWLPDIVSPFYVSQKKRSEVDDEFIRLNLGIRMPSRFIRVDGEPIELNLEQYDRYIVLSGKETTIGGRNLKQDLIGLIRTAKYLRASEGQQGEKENMILNRYNKFKARAREQLIRERPELRMQAREDQLNRLIAQ